MTLLFFGALALVAGQAIRIPPLQPPPFHVAWRTGTQILPLAVPPGEAPITALRPASHLELLRDRAVEWSPSGASGGLPCEIFVRVSRHHWARIGASRPRLAKLLGEELPAAFTGPAVVHITPGDLLEDRDGDGDPLDAGELRATGPGAETELFCAADGRAE
jgi:hypothetical protein